MKAVVQDKYGSPDVLELRDIDTPAIRDDEVLYGLAPPPFIQVTCSSWRVCHSSSVSGSGSAGRGKDSGI